MIAATALYFYKQKLGAKVLSSHSLREIEGRVVIDYLTLVNKKNAPLTIFSIYASLSDRVLIELDRFSPPLILKPLESLELKIPYSRYGDKEGLYLPNLANSGVENVFLNGENRIVKTGKMNPEDFHPRDKAIYRSYIKTKRDSQWHKDRPIRTQFNFLDIQLTTPICLGTDNLYHRMGGLNFQYKHHALCWKWTMVEVRQEKLIQHATKTELCPYCIPFVYDRSWSKRNMQPIDLLPYLREG